MRQNWNSPQTGASDEIEQQFAELNIERDRVRRQVDAYARTKSTGPRFEIGYVKFMIDGVLSTHTEMMKSAYSDDPDAQAEPFIAKDKLDEMVAAAHKAGFPVAVHAIGDQGVSWVLDAFSAAPRLADMPMDRVEHIEVVTPDG